MGASNTADVWNIICCGVTMKTYQILEPVLLGIACAGVMLLCYMVWAGRKRASEATMLGVVTQAFNPICYSSNSRDFVHTASDDAVFRAAKRLDIPKQGEEERFFIYTAILLESWDRGVADIALESVIYENETAQFRGKLVAFWKSRIELMAEIDHRIDWKGKRLFDGIALLASKNQEDYIECWGEIGSYFSERTPEITPEHGRQLMDELERILAK